MRATLLALTLALLSACGVDGPPQPPEDEPERPRGGITLSGEVGFGVSGGSSRIDYSED